MASEVVQVYTGKLTDKGVIIPNLEPESELEKKGYGERRGRNLILEDCETLYLLYTGRLELHVRRRRLTLDDLVARALKRDPDTWTRFLIYRDLRSKGYVVKEGFGFGVDFRVYERGEYGVKAAKYVVSGLNEGTELSTKELGGMVAQITRMGKAPIIAVIERRGEVIYYRVSRMRFDLMREPSAQSQAKA